MFPSLPSLPFPSLPFTSLHFTFLRFMLTSERHEGSAFGGGRLRNNNKCKCLLLSTKPIAIHISSQGFMLQLVRVIIVMDSMSQRRSTTLPFNRWETFVNQ